MSDNEDKDSKTEEPTPKKIQDAQEKGQTPVSRELPLLTSLVCFTLYLPFAGGDLLRTLGNRLAHFLERASEVGIDTAADANGIFVIVASDIALLIAPLLLILMAGGVISSIVQNEPRLVLDRVNPKASRISVVKGWTKLFGRQGLVEFLKNLVKLGFAGSIVFIVLYNAPGQLLNGMFQHPLSFGQSTKSLIEKLLITVSLVMAVVAAADLLWSRFHWKHGLRMSRKEVADELKQTEGDPILKARIRSVARDRSRQRMMEAVPTATMIITNPTHISVALRFDETIDEAPVVVAKGQDLIALTIRKIAAENSIPMFERVELARALNKTVSVDQAIPESFYVAVAELIRIIYNRT
ncbi:MAG: flagellar biosynthesis protein FlhB [Rhizobiaceae bacterium]